MTSHLSLRCIVLLIFLALSSPILIAQTPNTNSSNSNSQKSQKTRLKVGLVLSGGGARGVAHIGVLEWFEKHRIPVDYVAGTSMGGLVGGAYAMGMPPADILLLLKSINWDEALAGGPPFEELAFRRKEDRREYQVGIELGLKRGLSLPLGISSGHYIGMLIDRLTLPYDSITSFDQLPIPFRCVATDFERALPVTLKDGPLSSAMRATMSIPGAFPPVERDGKILVDGGMLNNIPTNAIKEFNPDVVIAVDIGTPLSEWKKIASLAGVLSQSILVMTIDSDRRNLRLADIIIAPDIGDLSTLDFSLIDQTYEKGFQASEQKAAVLEKFSLDEAEWQQYLAQRTAKRRKTTAVPTSLQITGISEGEGKQLLRSKLERFIGQPLDVKELELQLTKFTGLGRYESLEYTLLTDQSDPSRATLLIDVKPRVNAPPTIDFAIEIDGSEVNDINFTLGSRLTFYDVAGYGSELRTDIRLGFRNLFAVEYYRPLGRQGFFFAPHALYRRERQGIYSDIGKLTDYQADRYGIGVDLGHLTRRTEVRLGYELGRLDAKSLTLTPLFRPVDGTVSFVRFRATFDGQDSATVPTSGLRATAEGRWYFKYPGADYDFPQAEIRGSYFKPLSSRGSLFAVGSAGTTFNKEAPVFQQFLLGGPFRYGALDRDEVRANHYFLASLGYMHGIYQLPPLIGGRIYATGWFDQLGAYGGANEAFGLQRHLFSGSLGVVMDTRFGPFSLIGSYGEAGKGKIYFSLGRFF